MGDRRSSVAHFEEARRRSRLFRYGGVERFVVDSAVESVEVIFAGVAQRKRLRRQSGDKHGVLRGTESTHCILENIEITSRESLRGF